MDSLKVYVPIGDSAPSERPYGFLFIPTREVAPLVVEIHGDGGPSGWLDSQGCGFLLDRGVCGLLAAAE